jgi:hypothetical protein
MMFVHVCPFCLVPIILSSFILKSNFSVLYIFHMNPPKIDLGEMEKGVRRTKMKEEGTKMIKIGSHKEIRRSNFLVYLY